MGLDISPQALPVKPAAQQHVLSGRSEGHQGGVQILLIIKIGLLDESFVFRILAHSRAIQQLQDAIAAQLIKIDVDDQGIV